MLTLLGLTSIRKSDIFAETDVCASTMFPCPSACTVPPLKNTTPLALLPLLDVGVAVIVTVAVDPACKETGPQVMLVFVDPPPPQVPELMLPLTFVSGTPVTWELRFADTTMLLAGSGPLFVSV